jgi:hypothetical protein
MGQSPIPQYYSEANDAFEPIQGEGGAQNVRIIDGHDQTQGSKADAAASDSTSSWSLVSLLKGVWGKLEAIYTRLGGTLAVNGTVNVGNLPSTQTVAGSVSVSNFPATQTVSGTVATNTTLVASIPAGTNVIGKTGIDSAANGVKNVDGSGNELFTVANPANVTLQASGASGAAVPSKIVQVGGVNSGNLYALTLDSANRLIATLPTVEGAAGQAAPTKFLMLGATDGTTAQALKVDAQKNLQVGLRSSSGLEPAMTDGGNDGKAQGVNGVVGIGYTMAYNGASWDRWRNNTEGTLLASAARTTTPPNPTFINHNARAVTLTLNVTANPGGSETLTLRLRYVDPVSGTINSALASITTVAATNATYRLMVGLGASSSPDTPTNSKAYALPLPRNCSVEVLHSGTGSWTYSLGYSLSV